MPRAARFLESESLTLGSALTGASSLTGNLTTIIMLPDGYSSRPSDRTCAQAEPRARVTGYSARNHEHQPAWPAQPAAPWGDSAGIPAATRFLATCLLPAAGLSTAGGPCGCAAIPGSAGVSKAWLWDPTAGCGRTFASHSKRHRRAAGGRARGRRRHRVRDCWVCVRLEPDRKRADRVQRGDRAPELAG